MKKMLFLTFVLFTFTLHAEAYNDICFQNTGSFTTNVKWTWFKKINGQFIEKSHKESKKVKKECVEIGPVGMKLVLRVEHQVGSNLKHTCTEEFLDSDWTIIASGSAASPKCQRKDEAERPRPISARPTERYNCDVIEPNVEMDEFDVYPYSWGSESLWKIDFKFHKEKPSFMKVLFASTDGDKVIYKIDDGANNYPSVEIFLNKGFPYIGYFHPYRIGKKYELRCTSK